jgi:hypothetical protein
MGAVTGARVLYPGDEVKDVDVAPDRRSDRRAIYARVQHCVLKLDRI